MGIPIITVPKGTSRETIIQPSNNEENTSKKEDVSNSSKKMESILQPNIIGERKEILSTVRSGQQVYARGPKAQLIILGNVSSGAEVIIIFLHKFC